MYCKAQLSEDNQNKARMSPPIWQLSPMTIQIHDQSEIEDTTVQITHPFDKTKRSLLNHLELLGLALKNLIEVPDSSIPGKEGGRSTECRVDDAPCEQDVGRRSHSHRGTLKSRIDTSENAT